MTIRILVLIVISVIGLSINEVMAQNKQPLISLEFSEASPSEIFQAIEKQTDFHFAFGEDVLNISERISMNEKQIPVSQALDKLNDYFELEFIKRDKLISVKRVGKELPSGNGSAVSVQVSGKVTDGTSGEPVVGANLFVKSSTEGLTRVGTLAAIADDQGNFDMMIPDRESNIVVSAIGYKTQEVQVNDRTHIDILMEQDIHELEEVVVVGYISQATRDITGAVEVVNTDNVRKVAVNGLDQALKGQVAGIQITNDGSPGGKTSVRIRGYSTVGDNDPLYIIDGVPTKQDVNQFSINDVASIQVLKDASAAAIYGSRATNGVIIITTKKGIPEKTSITLDSYIGLQQAVSLPKMLNTFQYADMLWKAEKNSGKTPSNDVFGNGQQPVIPEFIEPGVIPSSVPGTDWFHEVFKAAPMQSHSLCFMNGSKKATNMTSLGYMNQHGTMVYTGFERYNFRTNTEVKTKAVTMGENLSISYSNVRSVPTNQALGSRMIHTYRINPIVPVKDIYGNWAGPVSGVDGALNPVAMNFLDRNDRNGTARIFGNIYGDFIFLKDFTFRTSFGGDYIALAVNDYNPKYKMGINERSETSFMQSQSSSFQWMWNNTLQYKRYFGKHYISAIAGTEAISFRANVFGASKSGFISDDKDYIQLSSGQGAPSNFGSATAWALFSQFGRVEYDFDERYLGTVSLRRDGSSRFGESERFALFPAFSLGWRISAENFMQKLKFVDDIKVRFSWGQTGNQEIADFATYSSFSSSVWNSYYDIDGSNNQATVGYKVTRIGNSDLKWETTTQTDFGADLSLFQKLRITADYFVKGTKDILIQRPTLAVEGQANAPYVNIGKMRNKGMEITLTYNTRVGKNFSMQVAGNMSAIRNKVVALASDVTYLTGLVSDTYSRGVVLSHTQVGYPIAQFYGYIADGIFRTQEEVNTHADQPGKDIGRIRYRDLNNDHVIDENDQQVIGSPHPKFLYGITLSAAYKNFDFMANLQGVEGAQVYNFTRYYTDFYYDLGNRHQRILQSWTPQNPNATIPMVSAVDANNELRPSTYFIENGSFLRCKSIEIGYMIRRHRQASDQGIRLFARAHNLFTLTSYQGVDPEVGLVNHQSADRNRDIGVDRGIYPNSRTIMFGFNLKI